LSDYNNYYYKNNNNYNNYEQSIIIYEIKKIADVGIDTGVGCDMTIRRCNKHETVTSVKI